MVLRSWYTNDPSLLQFLVPFLHFADRQTGKSWGLILNVLRASFHDGASVELLLWSVVFSKANFLLLPHHVCLSPAAPLPARFIPTARPGALTWRSYRLLSSSWCVVLSLPFITLFTALCLCHSICCSPSLIGTASVRAQILLSLPVSALHTGAVSLHILASSVRWCALSFLLLALYVNSTNTTWQ